MPATWAATGRSRPKGWHMTTSRSTRRRRLTAVLGLAAAAVLAGPLVAPAQAVVDPVVDQPAAQGLDDVDTRVGSIAPTSAQRSAVSGLGATARWNRFGTPQSLIKYGGYLATGLSQDPAAAARAWLKSSRGQVLFRLTAAQVDRLELVSVQPMAKGSGNAVLFRQKFGTLRAAVDGMVTVGVVNGKVAYVSSSIAPTTATPLSATLSPKDAWLKAAQNVGRTVTPDAITGETANAQTGWTTFDVAGFAQEQQVRLRALPSPNGTVRSVFEVNVVDVQGGAALAYTSFVDARSGAVLVRHSQVDQSAYTETFEGEFTAATCGPMHPYTVDAATKSITAVASALVPSNDIVLKLIFNGNVVQSSDTGTSPEAVMYSPTGGVPAGVYNVQVCPYLDPTAPFVPPGNYVGSFTASEQDDQGVPYPPQWKYFLSNPVLDYSPSTTDNRQLGCWVSSVSGTAVPDCDNPPSPLINLAARGPWDYNFRTNTPTFTTEGNAAETAEAWTSPLTPGAFQQRPVESDRTYDQPFGDVWNNSRCNPAALVPGGNDILPAVTSLFSSHNRLHDWAYFLGFTELNYNLQDNNFGNRADGTVPSGGEGDPEIGNVQAGALTGGAPSYLGRDNANQITLQDGVPGITNQYLFQPIAGAFYAPCVDGDFDMSIIGHEYNHAISNRMVGGPDSGLTAYQGGSMGESWGDQVALEYQFEHGYSTGADSPAVEGAYATGNKTTGIRNYALDKNPLQYGDLGYDVTGPEVHADGEPWSAVMWDVRQALITKYNGAFPVTNAALQRRCSQGDLNQTAPQAPLDASRCPGNRRWMQLLFDAYLLQPPGSSMLDARDAMLAADMMRFNGANQAVMWNAFAKRGYGQLAATATGEDDQPTPDYTSPAANEGTLKIDARAFDKAGRPAVKGTLYLGQYEARVTPVADTDPATTLGTSVRLVPGTYNFVFQAKGYGLMRFTQTVGAGQTVGRTLHLATNLASASSGATIAGSSAGSLNSSKLIDDTEASNWAGVNPAGVSVDTLNPYVTVDLAGGQQLVRSVRVSAMLRPADPDQDEDPNQPDQESGSRFTALRKFAIETCVQSATVNCAGSTPTPGAYQQIYVSPDNAFPGTAPRPLAPNLIFQTFDVRDTPATHVRLVALENQCSGTPEYAGEQDDDPLNDTDCKTASDRDESVRAAELEVFGFDSTTRPPGDPVVVTTMTGPPTAAAGSNVTYNISYTNFGPAASSNAMVTDVLPPELSFVSATRGGAYTATTRTVRWGLGTVGVNASGSLSLTAKIDATVPIGTIVLNQAQFSGALTFSPPAAAVTTVVP
ncbi:MAG: peptidase fungalysin [Blastococcus sp.]|jgi:extracellular elastinolytic metalloproteinase|nr:peptidase fungalysin [Blastococcus sp.]